MKKIGVNVLIGLAVIMVLCAGRKPEEMSREEKNKLLVKVAIGAINAGDWETLPELYSEKFIQHGTGDSENVRWTEFELGCRIVHNRLPDLRCEIEDIIAEDDKVVVRLRWKAKRTKNKGYRNETTKEIGWSEIDIMRIAGGKIVEEWTELDTANMKSQLLEFRY